MGFDPVDMDTLAARCQLDTASISAQLLTFELEGLVEMLPGGMYRRLN
jgi:DNA processing protein